MHFLTILFIQVLIGHMIQLNIGSVLLKRQIPDQKLLSMVLLQHFELPLLLFFLIDDLNEIIKVLLQLILDGIKQKLCLVFDPPYIVLKHYELVLKQDWTLIAFVIAEVIILDFLHSQLSDLVSIQGFLMRLSQNLILNHFYLLLIYCLLLDQLLLVLLIL